jgi:hypothetical protein
MPAYRLTPRCTVLSIAACASVLVVAAPFAAAAPSFDSQGYVNSTARCAAPETAVLFGSTATSRVAICADPDGDFHYRGVRVRDGAKLILSATRSSDGAFTATNDGIDYMVTSSALVVSAQERVLRDEPMVDFHRPGSSSAPAQTSTTPLPPPLPAEEGAS